jgi:hypothetical protein
LRRLPEVVTLTHQSWLFAVGSTFFAVATAPGVAAVAGPVTPNVLCFIGSWFFTSAAWIQLVRSSPEGSIGWFSAATQFGGTLLFNVSTAASVWAHEVLTERRLVWAPDATGSAAFLVSGALGLVAVAAATGSWAPASAEWRAAWVNMIGCVAFGVSAAGAFVEITGSDINQMLATAGTFSGALCFLAAALMVLPRFARDG